MVSSPCARNWRLQPPFIFGVPAGCSWRCAHGWSKGPLWEEQVPRLWVTSTTSCRCRLRRLLVKPKCPDPVLPWQASSTAVLSPIGTTTYCSMTMESFVILSHSGMTSEFMTGRLIFPQWQMVMHVVHSIYHQDYPKVQKRHCRHRSKEFGVESSVFLPRKGTCTLLLTVPHDWLTPLGMLWPDSLRHHHYSLSNSKHTYGCTHTCARLL